MPYSLTTINSTEVARVLMESLDTQMISGGWTFVETWISSNNTANIYKSPAASNSINMDYYIAFLRTSNTATSVIAHLFEEWDSVNKFAKKFCPSQSAGGTNTVPNQTTYTHSSTGVLLTSNLLYANTSTYSQIAGWTGLNTVTLNININPNRIIIGRANTASDIRYYGIMDGFYSQQPWVLGCIAIQNGDNANTSMHGSSTRFVANVANVNNFALNFLPSNGAYVTYNFQSRGSTPLSNPYTGDAQVFPLHCGYANNGSVSGALNRTFALKDMLASNSGGSNFAGADTLALTASGTTKNYISIARSTTNSGTLSHWFPVD